jgi:septum formation protein
MRKIILASQSPRRKWLMQGIFGDNFEIHVSEYEEDNNLDMEPTKLAEKHALGKAKDVADKHTTGVVIGGDVFVVYQGKVLGKPVDEEDAFNMLKKILGNIVDVISSIAVIDIDNNKEYVKHVITKVKMNSLTDEEILAYIKTGDPMDKAGSFGMQDKGAVVVEKINGCYSNVVGLPLPTLHKILKKIGIKIFDY